MAIQLGDQVKDHITGYEGMVYGITEWLYGCRRIAVQSSNLKDGKPQEFEWFDEQRLTLTPAATSGGPQSDPRQRQDPSR